MPGSISREELIGTLADSPLSRRQLVSFLLDAVEHQANDMKKALSSIADKVEMIDTTLKNKRKREEEERKVRRKLKYQGYVEEYKKKQLVKSKYDKTSDTPQLPKEHLSFEDWEARKNKKRVELDKSVTK